MNRELGTVVKLAAFVAAMLSLTVCLFAVFGDFRSGSTAPYSAVFTDVSDLHAGDSVRMAGIRVGTVKTVLLQRDKTVLVDFGADPTIKLTTGSRAAVRYLNLVGDRYLEIIDGPGPTRLMPPGSRIQSDHTAPALDLDVLLNGLKPVVQGLNPNDVNQLTASLIKIMQGEGGTMESLLSQTSSFTRALADNAQILERLIDNLNTTMATLASDGDRFAGAIDRLRRLVAELSSEREPIGAAVDSLSNGTASLVSLLGQARRPLAGTVAQVKRLAPSLDADKDRVDGILQKLPEDYRKLARMGSYGSFFNYYLCGVTLRVSDLQGRTAVFPWVKETTGRCAENP